MVHGRKQGGRCVGSQSSWLTYPGPYLSAATLRMQPPLVRSGLPPTSRLKHITGTPYLVAKEALLGNKRRGKTTSPGISIFMQAWTLGARCGNWPRKLPFDSRVSVTQR